MRNSGPDDFGRLLPDRRSKYIFLARMVALAIMTGAVLAYGLWRETKPTATPAPAHAGRSATPLPSASLEPAGRPYATSTFTPLPPVTAEPSAHAGRSANTPGATGVLTEDVVVLSEDGLAILKLSRGTKILDAEGQPLAPVSVSVIAREVPLRSDIAVVGLAYEFSPEGATLAPPAPFTVRYNPRAYYPFAYQSVDCSQLHMAYFGEKGPVAPWLDVKVDSEAPSVTAEIDHLGTLIIFCEVFGVPIS